MACEMLNEDTGEPFERTEHGPMDHHGRLLLAVRRYVESTEAARHIEIDLRRAALPFAPDRIAQRIFELRAIKCALARIDGGLGPALGERLEDAGQGRLGPVPGLIRTNPLFWPGRQFDQDVVKAEVFIYGEDEVIDLQTLLHDLIFGAKNMRVVLGEGAHPHDAVNSAGGLIAVDDAKLADLHRKVAIRFEAILEDLHMARTVHRFQSEDTFVFCLGDEHVFMERLPVAGRLPERAIEHLRRVHLEIPQLVLAPPHVGNQGLKQGPAFGMPENRAWPFFLKME